MKLIDANALMEQMKRRKEFVGRPSDPVCLVEDAPTIEAEPVKHGKWSKYLMPSGMHCFCSVCKKEADWDYKFCPHCGARMDEVDK